MCKSVVCSVLCNVHYDRLKLSNIYLVDVGLSRPKFLQLVSSESFVLTLQLNNGLSFESGNSERIKCTVLSQSPS